MFSLIDPNDNAGDKITDGRPLSRGDDVGQCIYCHERIDCECDLQTHGDDPDHPLHGWEGWEDAWDTYDDADGRIVWFEPIELRF